MKPLVLYRIYKKIINRKSLTPKNNKKPPISEDYITNDILYQYICINMVERINQYTNLFYYDGGFGVDI